jgi:hypothetical protein
MSTTTDSTLAFVRVYVIARCFYLIVFVIGVTGNSFNLLVFLRRRFRRNSCSIYFIAYSINNIISLTVGLLLWSLTFGFHFDMENQVLSYCKIRRYFTHVNFLLSSCLLTMASINRYARVRQAQMTKHRQRYISLCKRRTTYIVLSLTIVFCLIANVHIPIFFEIHHDECYARPGLYRYLFDIFFLVFYALLPPISMIAINIATVVHIRSIKKLVHPTVSRREYNLIVLVIAHSVTNAVLTLPFTINKFVNYMFANSDASEESKLASVLTLLIAFMNPGFSFFLYTLTTRAFRHEFVRACRELLMPLKRLDWRTKSTRDQTPRHNSADTMFLSPKMLLSKMASASTTYPTCLY